MPIPSQTITIRDPGLGTSIAAPTTPYVLGTSSLGTVATHYTFSSKADVLTRLGQGPLPEGLCRILDLAGGPVHGMRLNGSVVGAVSIVTKHAIGASTGTITVAGAAFDAYEAWVQITRTGTLGTARFRYSLDDAGDTDGRTWSDEIGIPAGGVYVIPNTNMTATFVPGVGPVFFERGDTHEWTSTAPYYAVGDLQAAVNVIQTLPSSTDIAFFALTGRPANAAGGATMFGAIEVEALDLANQFRFTRWIMDGGIDTPANVIAAMAAVSDQRVSVCYGTADCTSSKPFAGWGTPSQSLVPIVAAEAARQLISTDLARVASGPLTGVAAISQDEFLAEAGLDTARLTTTRTWIGRTGFYLTNARIKSDPGSDYRYWQHGRIMDVACHTVYTHQSGFIAMGLRTNADGTIDERDALRLETGATEALRAVLTQPSNAEGTRGHVSDLSYRIDRTNNLQSTETVRAFVAIRPLGYPKFIETEIGFALNV